MSLCIFIQHAIPGLLSRMSFELLLLVKLASSASFLFTLPIHTYDSMHL